MKNEESGGPPGVRDRRTTGRATARHEWHLRIIATALAILWIGIPGLAIGQEGLHFPPTTFNILSPKTQKVIGQGHYTITPVADGAILRGDNRYKNGVYDIEVARLAFVAGQSVPRVVDFRHSFYNRDGLLEREGHADMKSGDCSCESTSNGKRIIRTDRLDFPADTYAGASILIPIQSYLEHNHSVAPLKLHIFNCVPGPKILEVEAEPEPKTTWTHYPGQLVPVKITPDFGLWTMFVLPFVPKIKTWFDPSAGWMFVGGKLARYYRGPEIVMVKTGKPQALAGKSGRPVASTTTGPKL